MAPTLTTSYSVLKRFLKPRSFGIRMWRGVWPPSNHGAMEPPARAFWPLVPRPAVFASPSAISSTVTRNRTWRTIPRVAGLSATTRLLPMPWSPRALMVARFRAMWLIVLLVWVTRSLPGIGHLLDRSRLPRDPDRQLHATARAKLLGRMEASKGLDR